MTHPHLIVPNDKIDLKSISTNGKELHTDREAAEAELVGFRHEIAEWQRRLYADGRQSLLIVLQGMDAAGKDGATRHVFRGVNPQGVTVSSFKQPSKDELARDYLWRIHREVPRRGMIAVFNRSHYEDVLIVRVEGLVSKDVWRKRYDQMNQFEQLLAENGTRILKFYLHISRDEQMERFRKRLENPNKHWKFSPDDLDRSKQWKEYRKAYEDLLEKCSTPHAPWYVIPGDQKWYRNWIIAKTILETLKSMNPNYPDSHWKVEDFDLDPTE